MKLREICQNIYYNHLKIGDVLSHSRHHWKEFQNWAIVDFRGSFVDVVDEKGSEGTIHKTLIGDDGYIKK